MVLSSRLSFGGIIFLIAVSLDYGTILFCFFCFVLREGLEWADIDWVDNGECLDLIEKVSTV